LNTCQLRLDFVSLLDPALIAKQSDLKPLLALQLADVGAQAGHRQAERSLSATIATIPTNTARPSQCARRGLCAQ
jgi:hypothetical protein